MSEKNNKYTPNLSFPEFTGEWEEKTLGEVCDSILTGFPFKGEDITDDASGHPILRAFSIGEGIIRHGKDYDKYYPYDAEKLKKYEVRKGDIVISMDGSVGKNIALISEKEERNLLIQRVARLRITDYPIHLIFQQIISQRFKDYAAGEKKGAVIAHISQKQIELFPIYIPNSPAEQQKIASCLSAMDELIAAQAEKVEALKEKKTGMMQQLFPQNGETTPRLCFPEFTGEWEEKKVKEIFEITRGQVLPAAKTKPEVDGLYKYPVYSSQTMRNGLMGYYNEALFNNAITWTTDGANAGTVRYRKGDFYCTNVCGVLLSKDGYANECIAELLNIICKSHVSFVGNPKLMNNVMAEIVIPIPSLQEQQKIADCLSALDDQIAAETEKITALKDYKKGLMQQLFPQPAK